MSRRCNRNHESPFPFSIRTVYTVLDDIGYDDLALIGDSDRTAFREVFDRLRLSHDDDVVAWLIAQGYVNRGRSVTSGPYTLDGARVVLTSLHLTSEGRQLLRFCREA